MAHLWTDIEEIDRIYLSKLPSGRVVKIQKAVRYDGITLLVGENGRLYTDQIKDYSYTHSIYRFTRPLMKGLRKLGAISPEIHDEYIRRCESADALRDRKWRVKSLKEQADALGIKLTAAQEKKLAGGSQ